MESGADRSPDAGWLASAGYQAGRMSGLRATTRERLVNSTIAAVLLLFVWNLVITTWPLS